MKSFAIISLALALAAPVAAPLAAAERFDLVVTGTLFASQPAGSTPVPTLNFGQGDTVTARWRLDTSDASFTQIAPVGGLGTAGVWSGIFSGGDILIEGNGGANPIRLSQTAQSFGALILVDNGNIGNGLRLDQIALNDGLSFATGSPTYGYSITGAPEFVFVNNINYARNAVLPGADPAFVTSLALPDLAGQWQPAASPLSFFLRFGFGAPESQAELLAAPLSVFGVANQQARIESVVPEPASWAMLITGFGLIGTTLRRRRAALAG